jgi:hypothetical protein
MKRYILILICTLCAVSVGAQQIKQQVISSAGGYNVSSGTGQISISWTLGETIIPSFTNGGLTLTHGFQGTLIITAVEENILNPVKVNIYPNPTSEIIEIEFDTPVDGEISLFLLDAQGKLVKTDKIEAGTTNKEINMQNFSSGIYYLRLTKGRLVNVYRVVKL